MADSGLFDIGGAGGSRTRVRQGNLVIRPRSPLFFVKVVSRGGERQTTRSSLIRDTLARRPIVLDLPIYSPTPSQVDRKTGGLEAVIRPRPEQRMGRKPKQSFPSPLTQRCWRVKFWH